MAADYSSRNPLVQGDEVAACIEHMPQPIAITGGTGFVGSHLVDTLCGAGLRPRVLVRNPEKPRWIRKTDTVIVPGSLEDPEALASLVADSGTVFHLAGVLRAGREVDFDRGNRVGTANLVEAVRRSAPAARFVHVSSLAAVGPSRDPEGLGPDDPPSPVSAYGRSKLAGEAEVAELGDSSRWCIVRPPAVYGPRDTDILEFFKMASRGLAAIPAGERWLTLSWVGDVVRAVLAAAACTERRQVFHLGEPTPRRLDRLFGELAEVGGYQVRVLRIPSAVVSAAGLAGSALQLLGWRRMPLTLDKTKELLASHWTARSRESLELLGVGPGKTFADGVELTWQWYRMKGWVS
jgi:nucleoside-diphosphate-sugar epimerase